MNACWPERAQLRGRLENSPCNVAALAQCVGLHVRTLQRRFEEHFHTPPKQWMIRDRLARGCALLFEGLSNKEIAARLGYSQQSNFCRDFKRVYGRPPQEFAQRAAGKSTEKPALLESTLQRVGKPCPSFHDYAAHRQRQSFS